MRKVASLIVASACALCLFMAAGCSGSGSSSAAASAASTASSTSSASAGSAAAAAGSFGAASSASTSSAASSSGFTMKMTDENLIKDDFEAKIRTIVRPETVMSALSEDEDAVEMFDAFGFDIEELATNVCNAITFEVKSVKVDGDKAILTVAVTTPDFENSDDYFDKKLEEKFAGTNVNSASMESLFKAFGELVNEMFTDPDMPKTTQDEEVEYEKVNGEWKMVDENLNAEWLNL